MRRVFCSKVPVIAGILILAAVFCQAGLADQLVNSTFNSGKADALSNTDYANENSIGGYFSTNSGDYTNFSGFYYPLPTAESSSPANGGILTLGSRMQVNFSDSINGATIDPGMSISPPGPVMDYTWSPDNSQLSIGFNSLEKDKTYIVSIPSATSNQIGEDMRFPYNISFVFSGFDTIAPDGIIDLSAGTAKVSQIEIKFTAPTDYSDSARTLKQNVAGYYVRYVEDTGTDYTKDTFPWDSASVWPYGQAPKAYGNQESIVVGGVEGAADELKLTTKYWFAVKSKDSSSPPNESPISNIISVNTLEDKTPPIVSISSPNGGEKLAGGTNYKILASAYDPGAENGTGSGIPTTAAVSMLYSDDSGTIYSRSISTLGLMDYNSSGYAWKVPQINSEKIRVKVRVQDRAGNWGEATSGKDFTIDSTLPSVSFVVPSDKSSAVPRNINPMARFSKQMGIKPVAVGVDMDIKPSVDGNPAWGDARTIKFKPKIPLLANTSYTVTLNKNMSDEAGNSMAADYSWSFTTSNLLDTKPPEIKNIKVNGVKVFDNDIISSNALVSFEVSDESGVDTGSINISMGAINAATTLETIIPESSGSYAVSYSFSGLAEGKYTLNIQAADSVSNIGTAQISDLVVNPSGLAAVNGAVLAYPNPFKPLRGQVSNISYKTASDSEIVLYIYNISGELVWKRKYDAGSPGGTAGYNEVIWDGRNSFSQISPNGTYICRVVSGGKVLATGKITVSD